jgi:cell division protein FtsB
METNQKATGAGNKKIFVGAIVALMLLLSFTFYAVYNEKSTSAELTSQKIELQKEFGVLSDTLNVRNSQIAIYMGKNAEMDKTIAEQQTQMENQKKQIQGLLSKNKLTLSELAKAKELIAQYQLSIVDLNTQIAELTKQNQELLASNQQLNSDLMAERNNTGMLAEQNKGLAKKVEVGSLLQIAKLDVSAIKTRNNGKEVEVKRAKAAQQLKIEFETGTNKVLDPGNLSLFVRIINPKGETIAIADQGSGTLQIADSEQPVAFTKKADVDYNQTNKKVIVYWGSNIQEAGTYKVEVYQSGYIVGQGALKLS